MIGVPVFSYVTWVSPVTEQVMAKAADADFFMSNYVKFSTNFGGITLKGSVIARFSVQLAIKNSVVGLAESAFSLGSGYFTNRVRGYGKQEAWNYALNEW